MMFVLKYRKLIAAGCSALVLIGLVWYIYSKGQRDCENEALAKQLVVQTEGVQYRKDVEHEVQNLTRDQLIDNLRSHGELRRADDY